MMTKKMFLRSETNVTVKELYEWIRASISTRFEQFKDDELGCVYGIFYDVRVGRFVDALRKTSNLDEFPDMPPRMMYLVSCLSNRVDFHQDAIKRAIEMDHPFVRGLISNIGGHAYLEFVREHNVELGPVSLQYLGEYSNLSPEEKKPFYREYERVSRMLMWLALPLRIAFLTYRTLMPLVFMLLQVAMIWAFVSFVVNQTFHARSIGTLSSLVSEIW